MTESKISKAQQKAVNKYVKNNYDRVLVTFPKGQKAVIQEAATVAGETVTTYIRTAVMNRVDSAAGEKRAE